MRSRQMLWQALNCFKNAKKPLKKFWFFSLPVNICNAELLPRSWPRDSYSLVIKCLRHYSLHQANEAKVFELSRQPPYSHELSGIIQWKSYPLLVTIATQASFPLLLSKVCLHNHLGERCLLCFSGKHKSWNCCFKSKVCRHGRIGKFLCPQPLSSRRRLA